MFHPDKGHVHHRLVGMGLTTKKAVWIIYAITFSLCIVAIIVVNIRDEQAGLFLIILGVGAAIFVRKLGYFEYLASDKFYGWFRDISDHAGLSHERRSFLNHQIEISQSESIEEMWQQVAKASEFLDMDYIEMKLLDYMMDRNSCNCSHAPSCEFTNGNLEPAMLDWNQVMHIILPLSTKKYEFGSMSISKNLVDSPLTPFTLRRIEQLRRTIIETLIKLNKKK